MLSGEGIGFLPAEVEKEVCTLSGTAGSVSFDADGEAGRLGLEAEYVVDGSGEALYVEDGDFGAGGLSDIALYVVEGNGRASRSS